MRELLERQYKADSMLYEMPHDRKESDHVRWLEERLAAHRNIGEYLGHNVEIRG